MVVNNDIFESTASAFRFEIAREGDISVFLGDICYSGKKNINFSSVNDLHQSIKKFIQEKLEYYQTFLERSQVARVNNEIRLYPLDVCCMRYYNEYENIEPICSDIREVSVNSDEFENAFKNTFLTMIQYLTMEYDIRFKVNNTDYILDMFYINDNYEID